MLKSTEHNVMGLFSPQLPPFCFTNPQVQHWTVLSNSGPFDTAAKVLTDGTSAAPWPAAAWEI